MNIVERGIKIMQSSAFKSGASAAVLMLALSGCAGAGLGSAKPDNSTSTAAASEAPVLPTAEAAVSTDESVASAGIPIPLISPRHEGVKVASIDPRSGLSALALNGGLPTRDMAKAYFHFDQAISDAETSKLNTPKDIRRVLKTLRFKAPEMLADGWYAVRAMAAANDPAFAQGVRGEVNKYGKDRVLKSLDDPNYVMSLPGASSAMAAVMASGKAENERMIELRKRFIETAYRFQKQKWGMITPLPADTAVETAQATPMSEKVREFLASLSPITPAEAYSETVMSRILAQGAREAMAVPVVSVSGTKDATSSCLNWARLNLNQCIAAAHFPSEEAWCVGTHAVEEVRTCWAAALPPGSN